MSDIHPVSMIDTVMLADSNIPFIDDSQLTPIVGDDLDSAGPLLIELISLFEEENHPKLAEIREACGKRDLPALARHIHFVAGSSGNMGLQRLSMLCRSIEKRCHKGDQTLDLDEVFASVHSTFSNSLESFHARFTA